MPAARLSARVRLRVVPGAARPGIVGRHGEGWKVRVAAAAERGAANHALVSLLAARLGVPARDIRLVSGHASRDKIVEVAGIPAADLEARLASAERRDA